MLGCFNWLMTDISRRKRSTAERVAADLGDDQLQRDEPPGLVVPGLVDDPHRAPAQLAERGVVRHRLREHARPRSGSVAEPLDRLARRSGSEPPATSTSGGAARAAAAHSEWPPLGPITMPSRRRRVPPWTPVARRPRAQRTSPRPAPGRRSDPPRSGRPS